MYIAPGQGQTTPWAGIQKSDFWPVHTDLEIFRPIYFMKNVFLSVRKMTLFIYLTELNFVRPLSFEIFYCLGRKFASFDHIPGGVKLFIVSN